MCIHEDSMVNVRCTITGKISDLPVKKIIAGIHEVYSVETGKYMPIIHNAITGVSIKFHLIKKDAIATDKPNRDLFISPGHMILHNGVGTKARDVSEANEALVKSSELHTLVTKNHEAIVVNGVGVYTESLRNFRRQIQKKKLAWKENK